MKEIVSSSANEAIIFQPKHSKKKRKPEKKQTPPLPTIIATDDGSWRAPIYNNRYIQVEKLSSIEAMHKYGDVQEKRLIVLCSWMPQGVDFTSDFRERGQVEEYILIGEADNGSCGHNWLTWGNPDFKSTEGDDCTAPCVADGYQRVNLDDLSLLQMSRFDCKRSSESMTVSFRRKV